MDTLAPMMGKDNQDIQPLLLPSQANTVSIPATAPVASVIKLWRILEVEAATNRLLARSSSRIYATAQDDLWDALTNAEHIPRRSIIETLAESEQASGQTVAVQPAVGMSGR